MKNNETPMTESDLIPLARQVGAALAAAGLVIATAESCTGGLVGHLITEIPGSSAWFYGCAGVYSNAAKERLLGVRSETLLAKGAVSGEVAQQMAQGALSLYGADVAVSITGIAGPGGGTAEKPTGLVHLHLSAADGSERAERVVWTLDRRGNKLLSAQLALRMLLEYAAK
ncbi:MAG: nicotinamide-nucleotide amidohydrolase family protein [Caldilineaceae bacterium]|nr:nicotinamide-nucleotide amidohydrolase family protein [Caldilineaceae bacterium]HRJ44071.1 CinA family protein [Caldilineaceae bacterium]